MKNAEINILLVEDNPADVRLVCEMLKGCINPAFKVTPVNRLAGGLKQLKDGNFEAVLLDLGLPDSRGLEGLEKIVAQEAAMPVIVLTGVEDDNLGVQALKKGAADYLAKGKIETTLLIRSIRYSIERKRADEAVRKSESRYRSYVDLTGQVAWTTNAKGEVEDDLPAWRRFTGQSKEEVTGQGWSKALHPKDIKPTIAVWQKAVAGMTPYETEYRLRRFDGQYRYVIARGVPIFREDKSILEWIGACIDITERKEQEEKLKESEEKYRRFVDQALIGFYKFSLKGKLLYVNQALVDILEYDSAEELLRLGIEAVYPDQENRKLFLALLKKQRSVSGHEIRTLTKAKNTRFLLVSASLDRDGISGMVRDITERKRYEEFLRKAKERLELKVKERTGELAKANQNLHQDMLARKEIEKGIRISNAMLKLLNKMPSRKEYLAGIVKLLRGLTRCRCVGVRVVSEDRRIPYESYVGFSREFWNSENNLCVKTDQCICIRVFTGKQKPEDKKYMTSFGSFSCQNATKLLAGLSKAQKKDFRGVCISNGFKSLAVIPITYKDRILGVIHIADEKEGMLLAKMIELIESLTALIGEGIYKYNLTDQIVQANELLERVFASTHLLIAYMDKNFNFIRVNEAYAKIDNHLPEFFVGKNHFDLYPNEESKEIFRKVIETGRTYTTFAKHFEYTGHPERGRTYWDWSLQPVKSASGEVEGLILFFVDVTERKNAQEQLQKAQDELNKAKRLSDIGTLAATVAHELRNPLAAIRMAAYNVKRKAQNQDLERHFVNIDKKVSESDQIINNLLFYSRLKIPHCERVSIRGILDESIENAKTRHLRQEVKLSKNYRILKDTFIDADPLQLKELFGNILNNSFDAVTDKKGKIEVFGEFDSDGHIKVSVTDNGCGIDQADLHKLFEPFFTTKAKGTGLGLVVCRQIAELHRGSLCIDSKKGTGTTATLYLPLCQETPQG